MLLTSTFSCVISTTTHESRGSTATDRVLKIIVGSFLQFADQTRQNLFEVPHDHHVLGVLPLSQLFLPKSVAWNRGSRKKSAQLPIN